MKTTNPRVLLVCVVFLQIIFCASSGSAQAAAPQPHGLSDILQYISNGWNTLTRSTTQCSSVADPKLKSKPVMYLPADYSPPTSVQALEKQCAVDVEKLPKAIHRPGELDVEKIQPPGLLFLEKPYVVPGGRFNEMYGWDSYFIIRGLLEDGRVELARDMVENFFFEIEHYGTVLNANRTYMLTRSQPPFLTSMILAVYDAEKRAGHQDSAWLARAYSFAATDYQLWTHAPHLAGTTGLSRYFDFGEGPAPEATQGEGAAYRRPAGYFLLHPEAAAGREIPVNENESRPVLGQTYAVELCDTVNASEPATSRCDHLENVALTPEYYKGDRSMRESGFDISFRFGPFGADTHHYAAVCLNSLLYKYEKDMEQIGSVLGRDSEAREWHDRAEKRRRAMQSLLWDAQRGMYFDYDAQKQVRSTYEYIATFYPLWAGLATPEQASALVRNLKVFEHPGGLAMSRTDSGMQWDYPYGWAPTQLVAIEGLRRYGFNDDANRVSYAFLSTILENFRRDGTIREKYNVVTRSSETPVRAGYTTNEVGFGWTNAAFLALLHQLPRDWASRLEK